MTNPSGALIASVTPLYSGRRLDATQRASSRRPSTSCFIATAPRSGSWLLSELLWNTRKVGEPHEYFRPDLREPWADEWGLPESWSIKAYIDAAIAYTQTPSGVFAAKLHWYQLVWLSKQISTETDIGQGETVDLANWFPNPRYVLLRRHDKARQAVSYYRAATTGVWYETEQRGPYPAGSDCDLQQVRWFEDALIQQESNWRAYLNAVGETPLEVCYEDMAADMPGTVDRVLSFLNLPTDGPVPVPAPRLRAQSDAATDDVLKQYLAARDDLEPRPAGMEWREEIRRFVKTPTPSRSSR
jgi:trehalose 2-sulfotransferase